MSESRETELIEAIIENLDDSKTEYTKTPQSRNEEILVSILNETEYTKTPQSREEELLLELKEKIGGLVPPVPPVIKRVTGNPIEFTDGADAPLVKCVTQITGSQDLHGYDKPWVGGAGKNKLPLILSNIKAENTSGTWTGNTYSVSGGTFVVNVDSAGNIISIEGAQTNQPSVIMRLTFTLSAGTYILTSGFNENFGLNDTLISKDGTTIARGNSTSPGSQFTLSEDSVITWMFRITTATRICTPMIRLFTETDPTFAPYSNICPITAYTEGEIEVSDGDGNTTTHTTTYPSAIYRGSEDVVNGEVTSEMPLVDLDECSPTTRYTGSVNKTISFTLPYGYRYSSSSLWKLECLNEYFDYVGKVQGATALNNPDTRKVGIYAWYASGDGTITTIYIVAPLSVSSYGHFAYELATPTTSSVTVSNLPIKSLSGYNHIESSTGEMTIDYITDAYQNFVDTVESALPNTTRKGVLLSTRMNEVTAMDIFLSLDNPKTPDQEKVDEIQNGVKEETIDDRR